jgi:Peptidase propeptide and YPEB domain
MIMILEVTLRCISKAITDMIILPSFCRITLFLGSPSEIQLMKEAKVSKAQAEKTAIGKVRNGTIKSGELEREHGKLIWSFDIGTNGTKNITEVQVNAKDGTIVSVQMEPLRDQAREAAGEQSKK